MQIICSDQMSIVTYPGMEIMPGSPLPSEKHLKDMAVANNMEHNLIDFGGQLDGHCSHDSKLLDLVSAMLKQHYACLGTPSCGNDWPRTVHVLQQPQLHARPCRC